MLTFLHFSYIELTLINHPRKKHFEFQHEQAYQFSKISSHSSYQKNIDLLIFTD